jgi:methionine sulfoxide reductase heme-binding subunit
VTVSPVVAGGALSLSTVALSVVVFGATVEGAQAAARWSARTSFLLFALAFTGPSWNRLFQSPAAHAVADREWPLTLAFAGSHLVHLVALAVYVSLTGHELDPVRLAGGALGYALLLLVLFRPPARSWAFYYLWFIFFMTYLPRVRGTLPGAGGAPWTFPLFLSLVVLILAVRVGAIVRRAALMKEG